MSSAATDTVATASIGAQNTFTQPLRLKGAFLLKISGTFVATVVLQRRKDSNEAWASVTKDDAGTAKTMTGVGQWIANEPTARGAEYRAGVETGGYTSGTAVVTIEQ